VNRKARITATTTTIRNEEPCTGMFDFLWIPNLPILSQRKKAGIKRGNKEIFGTRTNLLRPIVDTSDGARTAVR
jgi:hypothetical protein